MVHEINIDTSFKENPLYKVLQILYEDTRKEFKYFNQLEKKLPNMDIKLLSTLLEQLLEKGYVTNESVHRKEKSDDEKFYSITLTGALLFEDLKSLGERYIKAQKDLSRNQSELNKRLSSLEEELSN